MTSALALICAITAGVAASASGAELTRGPTQAELEAAAKREVADRWRSWPAGKIFPATITYVAEQGGKEKAHRVGISASTDCVSAVDRKAAATLRRAGCEAVLRATYLDELQGVVVTVGVLALPDELRAVRAKKAFPISGRPVPGLRPVAFQGTVTERFTPQGRQTASVRQAGPYVVLTTAGQVDGRPARAVGGQRPAVFAFAADLGERVLVELSTPRMPDCGSKAWRC
ncbi:MULTISPECIES: hypothetical protein [Nonomuraea]|uniref:Uncharacterized protein n=1 Tax=Nonomuraea mangrovi TaxID=2316207 RepID=A0ABW4TGS3_9ACTN